jgi:hypothetical protein
MSCHMVVMYVFSALWIGLFALVALGGLLGRSWLATLIGIGFAAFAILVLLSERREAIAKLDSGDYYSPRTPLARDETAGREVVPGIDHGEMVPGQFEPPLTILGELRRMTLCRVGIHRIMCGSVDTDTSSQTGACKICRRPYQRGAHHLSDWVYRKSNRCDQERPCLRCGEFYGHPEEHDWDYKGFRGATVCRRCGETMDSNTGSPR